MRGLFRRCTSWFVCDARGQWGLNRGPVPLAEIQKADQTCVVYRTGKLGERTERRIIIERFWQYSPSPLCHILGLLNLKPNIAIDLLQGNPISSPRLIPSTFAKLFNALHHNPITKQHVTLWVGSMQDAYRIGSWYFPCHAYTSLLITRFLIKFSFHI